MHEMYIMMAGFGTLIMSLSTLLWCNPVQIIKKDTVLIKTRCLMTQHYDQFKGA